MGYVEVEMQPACNLFPAGTKARGHVFHFSEIVRPDLLSAVLSINKAGSKHISSQPDPINIKIPAHAASTGPGAGGWGTGRKLRSR